MQKFTASYRDHETGLVKKVDYVKFRNGAVVTLSTYQIALKRQLFRRAVVNRHYHLNEEK